MVVDSPQLVVSRAELIRQISEQRTPLISRLDTVTAKLNVLNAKLGKLKEQSNLLFVSRL